MTQTPATPIQRATRVWLTVAATALLLSACETVDLGMPEMVAPKQAGPDCTVSASDYKTLAYLQQDNDVEKATRIIAVLKKKYAAAPLVDGQSPVVAAMNYLEANADKSPVEIESTVESACPE